MPLGGGHSGLGEFEALSDIAVDHGSIAFPPEPLAEPLQCPPTLIGGQLMIRVLLGTDLKPDTVIVNYDGTRVWLKEAFDTCGKRIGVIDCCLESTPCQWHAALRDSTQRARDPLRRSGYRAERGASYQP